MPRSHGRAGGADASFYCASALSALTLLSASCRPDAASNNAPDPADTFPPNKILTSSDEAAVQQTFDDLAQGRRTRPLAPAPNGFRWSDVPGALRAAASHCTIGVATMSVTDAEVRAVLHMPDGQDGTAVVTKTPTGVAVHASLGVSGDPDTEAKFEAVFLRALKRMGAERRPQE